MWTFISQHILDMENVLLESFQYRHSWKLQDWTLLHLAIFPDLEMKQFWSVYYICQVCKSKLLFWTCLKFWAISILIGSYLYILSQIYSHCIQNCTFWYFIEIVKIFVFSRKYFQSLLIFKFFYPKFSNFHNSGMVCL